MNIELIDEPTVLPLEDLLTYLNEEVYSKMSVKDQKDIKSKYLGGKLVHAIDTYKNKCVYEALVETRKLHSDQIDNFKEIIKGLRDGREENRHGNKYIGNNRYVGD